jgi:hypothetical protein
MKTRREWRRSLGSPAYLAVTLLVLVNLWVGWRSAGDYGVSWDERRRFRYAVQSLSAYFQGTKIDDSLAGDEKGAAYVMAAKLGADLFNNLRADWGEMEAFHFVHFLSFQVGILALFLLCLRGMSGWAAFGTTLLFSTQPLLWGHAFINPKDIPFMALFLASLVAGLHMADRLQARHIQVMTASPAAGLAASATPQAFGDLLASDWRGAGWKRRWLAAAGLLLAFSLLLLLTFGRSFVKELIAQIIVSAYAAPAGSLVGQIFARLAENMRSVPVTNYVQRALSYYPRLALGLLGASWAVALALSLGALPATRAWLWRSQVQPTFSPRPFWRIFRASLTDLSLLAAAVILGFTSATRVLGPAAGALVAAYFLYKSGRAAIPALTAYALVALAVMYLLWPEMWAAPAATFLSSLRRAADFPWTGKVRFAGADYWATGLPASYLPVLMAIQFTEPAIGLIVLGLGTVIWQKSQRTHLTLMNAAWFLVPISLAIALHTPMYDNFRHFLFAIPPLFYFAGLGLQAIFNRLRQPLWRGAILAALVLPGAVWIARLHPYEYVYYNQLVGGVRGAAGQYEMDYWATSYKQAIAQLNQIAPQDARIVVADGAQIVNQYIRPDLRVYRFNLSQAEKEAYDYAVLLGRNDKDLKRYRSSLVVIQVGREGAIFSTVKKLAPGDTP